jgi:hypothetical protein
VAVIMPQLSTWGGNTNWCLQEMALRGPGNCIYDTRTLMPANQRYYYKESTQTPAKNKGKAHFSWRHFTDSIQGCNPKTKVCSNTNSYGPHCLFDSPYSK